MTKKKLFSFLTVYGIQIFLILFVANVGIYEYVHLVIFGQTCLTLAQIQADNRCLYMYGTDVYQKGSRSSPHHGHPCGSNVTSVMPKSHVMFPVRYLDPNLVGPVCQGSAALPTPTIIPTATPTPRPIPTATPIPTQRSLPPTATPRPIPTAVPIHAGNATGIPTATPTQIVMPTNTPVPTDEPTPTSMLPTATPTSAPTAVVAVSPTIPPTQSVPAAQPAPATLIASENNLEAVSQISVLLAALSLFCVFLLSLLKTKIGRRIVGRVVKSPDVVQPAQKQPPVVDKVYFCEGLTKRADGSTALILMDDTKPSMGITASSWTEKGWVKVSGTWEMQNGKSYLRITAITQAAQPV